jgi:hypothetical protein
MARSYGVAFNNTNTASASQPLGALTGAATIRAKIYDLTSGSDATPADNSGKYVFQRHSARGTQATSVTPQALDAADPGTLAFFDTAWTGTTYPTLTASAFLLQWAQNQRATFRWVAAPAKELVIPATASNGLSLMCTVVGGSAVNMVFAIEYEE